MAEHGEDQPLAVGREGNISGRDLGRLELDGAPAVVLGGSRVREHRCHKDQRERDATQADHNSVPPGTMITGGSEGRVVGRAS